MNSDSIVKLWNFRPVSFSASDTGEVVKGAKISLLSDVPYTGDSLGCPAFDKWISQEMADKLFADIKSKGKKLPCDVKVTLENTNLNSKPKIIKIEVL